MFQDLDELPGGVELTCDVCVVGSGAAGLALATELIGSGLRVLVVEGGGRELEPDAQALYESEIAALPFPGAVEGRFRVYGGSTTRWGGGSQALDPIDFERRDWVPESGWPVSLEALRPYYTRAAAFLDTDPHNWDTDLFPLLKATPPAFAPGTVGFDFYKSARRPNLGLVYRPRLLASADVTVLLHANVTRIDLAAPALDRVERVEVKSHRSMRTAIIKPGVVVLCTGGIEVARTLLDNDHQVPGGIGNGRGLVGRYLQDHPVARAGAIRTRDGGAALQRAFNTFYRRGLKYAARLYASAALQRRERILNAAAVVKFEPPADSPYRQLKESVLAVRAGVRGGVRRLVGAAARSVLHAGSIARPVWAYAVRGRGYTPRPDVWLAVTTEQEPDPGSRVTLAEERDALGVRRARVEWRLTDATRRTMEVFARAVAGEFARLGLGEVEVGSWLADAGGDWRGRVEDQYHHMGTTRMGESAEHGVVDPSLRVHGVGNLYVASSSVFPTCGRAGPTLTIIALAIRLGDELRRRAPAQFTSP